MCPSTSLLGFILLALFIVNASPAHLGIERMPLAGIPHQSHAEALYNNTLLKRDDVFYVEKKGDYYMARVVTSSAYTYSLIVDTGSSYTWVGAMESNPYVAGQDSMETPQIVNVKYNGGQIKLIAKTWRDRLALDALTINAQQLGVPTRLTGFRAGIDGILGLGPTGLTTGITSDRATIPTVVDNLYSEGTISDRVVGVYFVPVNVAGGGFLTFGRVDGIPLTSDVKYVPVTQSSFVRKFWGIDASFAYDSKPIGGPTSGVLDTGGALIYLPGDAFTAYRLAIGAALDFFNPNSLLVITEDQYNDLQTLSIVIGDQSYDLSPNAQIYPRSSPNDPTVLAIHSMDVDSRIGFVLGHPFFQRYYVVFNSRNSQIGFASHKYTYSTTN
ncbi:hypothetical protein ID866_5283 [Astraeus odoratus]|nr:hypothetical protein ID866_5283 [Astraeus odoratus]